MKRLALKTSERGARSSRSLWSASRRPAERNKFNIPGGSLSATEVLGETPRTATGTVALPIPVAGRARWKSLAPFGQFSAGFVLATFALLAGCSVGPDYHRPDAIKNQNLPAAFTGEASTNAGVWKAAEPAARLPHGAWWEIFGDADLNRLEALATAQNQTLAAAQAAFEQARAQVGVAKADYYPQLTATPNAGRQRTSVNAPDQGRPNGTSFTYNTFNVPVNLSWEIDLWGRVRRQTEGARARFAAAADDLEAARLEIQAEVASDYFTLRALDAERAIVADTVETYRHSLELTQNRRKGGVASDLDVSEAETQLRAAEAQLPALQLQRDEILHAIATLAGQTATGFAIGTANPWTNTIPAVPAGVPSELLERRPDVAAAERRMAAANADVGVAVNAFYPQVTLTGAAGFQSVGAGTLFQWPSRLWAIGPGVTLPLFTGGLNRAQLASARAAYDQSVANYRLTVLTAFQEVEDELAAEHLLAAQLDAQNAALAAARRTLEIANNRYKAGLVTYLEVAVAQSAALQNEQTAVELQGQRLTAQVALVRALGGGWQSGEVHVASK